MDDTVIFGDSIKNLKRIFDEGNTFAFQNKTPNEKPFERNPESLWKGYNHQKKAVERTKAVFAARKLINAEYIETTKA